jgi:hypothetical protein
MARQRKCNVCPEWHDTDEPWPRPCLGHFKTNDQKRSHLAAPYVISDDLGTNGLLNHADNKVYTSKAEYVRAVKRAGCEIVGNEKVKRPEKVKPTITDEMRREIRRQVQALDSPTRKLHERRRRRTG